MVSRVAEARASVLKWIGDGMEPGAPVSVKLTAERLEMSHTPVREALERLVGEGVLASTPDRSGFAIPRLSVRDVAGLHILFGTLLQGLAEQGSEVVRHEWLPDPTTPGLAVRQAVEGVCRGGRTGMTAAMLATTELRLASHRRVEPSILPKWGVDLVRLHEDLPVGGTKARRAIQAFTRMRVEAAEEIVAAVEDLHAGGSSSMRRI